VINLANGHQDRAIVVVYVTLRSDNENIHFGRGAKGGPRPYTALPSKFVVPATHTSSLIHAVTFHFHPNCDMERLM
jgi:hypothetical protein